MKKVIKLVSIFMIILMITILFSNMAMAYNWTDAIKKTEGYSGVSEVKTTTQDVVKSIISAIRTIAVSVAVIMLMVLAIKYMLASAGERAEIKKHAVVYVVGALILFSGSGILGVIANFAKSI